MGVLQWLVRPCGPWTRIVCIGWGIVYFCAFVSLYVQYPGLFGFDGLQPVDRYMSANLKHIDGGGGSGHGPVQWYTVFPTVAWFKHVVALDMDSLMEAVCLLGMLLSACIAAGYGCTLLFAVRVTINVHCCQCLLLTQSVASTTGCVAVVSLLLACWPDLPVLPMGYFACRSRCRTYCTVCLLHTLLPRHLTHGPCHVHCRLCRHMVRASVAMVQRGSTSTLQVALPRAAFQVRGIAAARTVSQDLTTTDAAAAGSC